MSVHSGPVAEPSASARGDPAALEAIAPAAPGSPNAILALQRLAGNAAVSRMVAAGAYPAPGRRPLQRKPLYVQGSRPPRYRDVNIPRATLIRLGRRLRDGYEQYRVEETGLHFFYDAANDLYYRDGGDDPIDPSMLSPYDDSSSSSSSAPDWPGGGGGGASLASPAPRALIGPLVDIHQAETNPKRKRDRPEKESSNANTNTVESEQETEPGPAKRARSSRLRWCPLEEFERRLAAAYEAIVDHAIAQVFAGVGVVHPYNMAGQQAATTNAEGQSFKTTLQKHSEMCALDSMLRVGTYHLVGGTVHPPPGGFQFTTPGVPHCGFCTFFLQLLGLPLSMASRGNFNLACNLDYPLPPAVFNDVAVLNRLLALGGARANAMNAVMALAAQGGAGGVGWADFVTRGYLQRVWRLLLSRLYRYLD